jgi:hypothetical protein
MDPDRPPLDALASAALVARIAREIRQGSEETRDALLSKFLCAAWPTCWAQDQ